MSFPSERELAGESNMAERYSAISPSLKARVAGVFYLASVLTAVFAEFVAPGKLGIAAIVIPVSCYAAVTLLLYFIFRIVSARAALLAVIFSLAGLALEALEWQPRGIDVAVVLHGIFCLLTGWLIFKSTFLPRGLGSLMAIAGVIWLIYLAPPVANFIAPYNTLLGLLGEGLPMLWLLVMGVNAPRWREQAATSSAPW
jgi:Domain of unknown function (DUF4386)